MKRSDLIIPISIVVHLIIISGTLIYFNPINYFGWKSLLSINTFWLLICFFMDFYPTGRKENFFSKLHRFIQVFLLFSLGYFTVLAFKRYDFSIKHQFFVLSILSTFLLIYRAVFFYFRQKYRILGGNSATAIIVGRDRGYEKLMEIFREPELGYRYQGYFDNLISSGMDYKGPIKHVFEFIARHNIDEIYCHASRLTKKELYEIIEFSDNNLKKIKIIPDNKEVFTRAMVLEMYDQIPILHLRKSPLENTYSYYGKRFFDIIFSGLVIIGLLSWLVPLMYLLIKIESPGPLFFKQKRHGLNKKVFYCYKFRSMAVNRDSNLKMATKNDMRITKIGKFIRKTSIDELPQFLNVFMGQMSVVGPRPHMENHTFKYETSVNKYLVRHHAKPGITGLAQVRGYRGEIVKESDIINRTRLDIFYLEKWSPVLDAKIIYSTMSNALRGDEKAY
ncbi:exopolysaccharide biosynthesis polyprenyl glycosylphosphotransferase [Salegentibacter flavus]|uniref:Putative colanic acid biosysnthesis UDP-glucose lipid carrier transferase n=1 Tax=Salegentibacter flavus TaxID=287099 RepID=A0A1I5BPF8_9FLAO|nr:exopolysaccharide biosynthesis polyprenyl glycosylphosphotransferase [Salegentibacter flavus]SFN76527.1 putative colanic acid biosysnthesis UDP-glucose lipid carrier transferase [Salegentibacter flavus]